MMPAHRSTIAFARRLFGTLHQAAIGDKLLDPGKTRDIMDLIQQDAAEDFPDPGYRLEHIEGRCVMSLGRFDDVALQVAAELVIIADHGQVVFPTFLDRRVGEPLRDACAVGFVGQVSPDFGQNVRAIGLLDVTEERRPFPRE